MEDADGTGRDAHPQREDLDQGRFGQVLDGGLHCETATRGSQHGLAEIALVIGNRPADEQCIPSEFDHIPTPGGAQRDERAEVGIEQAANGLGAISLPGQLASTCGESAQVGEEYGAQDVFVMWCRTGGAVGAPPRRHQPGNVGGQMCGGGPSHASAALDWGSLQTTVAAQKC